MLSTILSYLSVSSIYEVIRFSIELTLGSFFLLEAYAKRKQHFYMKAVGGLVVQIFLSLQFYLLRYLNEYEFVGHDVFLGFYVFLMVISVINLRLCYDITVSDALFINIASFAIQHIALVINVELISIVIPDWPITHSYLYLFYGIVVFVLLTYIFGGILRRKLKVNSGKQRIVKDSYSSVSFYILANVIFMSFTFLQQYLSNLGFEISLHGVLLILTDVFGCFLALALEISFLDLSRINEEKQVIEQLFKESKKQYLMSKENVDIINQKCHNLKHQIRALRLAKPDEQVTFLDELEQSVMIYDSVSKTDNEVLDTILTERNLYCEKHSIKMSCIVEPESLDFMNTFDIYSLFGNAFDNAIRSVEQIDNKDNRFISLKIHKHEHFLNIIMSNYFEDEIVFEGDLPRTSKADENFHGFGIKSIKTIAKKYGGVVTIDTTHNLFTLIVVLPI